MERRIVPLILLFAIIFTSSISFGERIFTDVPDDHWAYRYIKKAVDLGLMDGYDDATFRPNDIINTVEALSYITRLLTVYEDEIIKARETYDVLLNDAQLTEDARNTLAIALYRGFIDEEFIKSKLFTEDGIRKAIKVEISRYLAKAMGYKEGEENISYIFLYNDASEIPISEQPYVKFLIDQGVLDKKGDENRNFNPNQQITRAILAKMLSQAYDAMNGKSIIEVERIPDLEKEKDAPNADIVEEPVYEEISCTILMAIRDYIVVDTGDAIDAFRITEDTEIIVDGEPSGIEGIESHMNVNLLVSEEKTVKRMEKVTDNRLIHGIIKSLYLGEEPYIEVEMENGEIRTFILSENPEVVLDGRNSYLFSLDEGDYVIVESSEDKALFITGESREGRVLGILDGRTKDGNSILVKREDGTVYEYYLHEEVIVNRDSSRVDLKALRDSDELILMLKGGKVYRIDAFSVPSEDKGYIRSILISDEPVLTIEREDGNKVSYYISNRVLIVRDNRILNLYDLRLGDFAELKIRSDEIVNISIIEKE
ncbi:MAG TPA: S-layer homology domain-containing protein [Tissierellia bacterium]|nr:S-layer homology domain-containing protein [Tissierellia bacterium]